ncbi:unnamed protein product [Brassica rapa]|uniref:Uncharacterized protein n=2 Tax=Brassica TaxID=3705 RepID=A0A8D9D0C8_BRACM|nr:unnamed protein product [Brassica rapa]
MPDLSLSLTCLALEKARATTGLLSPLCHAGSLSLSPVPGSVTRRSWRELQSSDTDVGAVRDAMSMAVSHHAAAFTDGLQDVNYCHRVMVVGFKLLPERLLFFNGCLEFTVSTKCPYLRHLWRSLWSLSKLQSLFNQISFHTSQARNLKQRRT